MNLALPSPRFIVTAFLAAVLLDGCTNQGVNRSGPPNSLASNPDAPTRLLSKRYGKTWHNIANHRYDAFLFLDGFISPDGQVRSLRVDQAYPDTSRLALAYRLVEQVTLPGSTAASHVRQRAKVQLYFYESNRMEPEVLIVAWRQSSVGFNDFQGNELYTSLTTFTPPADPSPAADQSEK